MGEQGIFSIPPIVTLIALAVLWILFILDYVVFPPKGVKRFRFSRFVLGKVDDQPGPIAGALCLCNSKVRKGQVWRVFTGMLNHGGLQHIVINSVALWIVGGLVEPYVGSGYFFLALILSGMVASLCNMFVLQSEYSYGFSMAIFGGIGLLAAMLLRDPLFVQSMDWPQRIILLIYIIGSVPTDKYSWVEHSGGFVAGIVLAFWMLPA